MRHERASNEPGIPAKWNSAPFTVDYGRTGMYHHAVNRNGATYSLPTNPDGTPNLTGTGNEVFAGVSNPMDADIDASSNIYLATWRGGGFNPNRTKIANTIGTPVTADGVVYTQSRGGWGH